MLDVPLRLVAVPSHVVPLAVSAADAGGPAAFDEPALSGLVVGKHLNDLQIAAIEDM